MTSLTKYDAACAALAEAVAVDEVKDILDWAEAARVYHRQAKNLELEIRAVEIRLRAERRLGQVLSNAKETGQLAEGRPPKRNGSDGEPFPRLTLAEIGIDKKLSARAQKVGGIAERAFEAMVDRTRERMRSGGERVSLDLLKEGDKASRRAEREVDLALKQSGLPTIKFGVILADPEWRFEPWSRKTGMDRSADNHYPTSCTEVIAARDVRSIAADDSILWLWATVPMLPQALIVMGAWGFDYKSHFVWAKDRIGTGYWNRNKHELLLIGTRGHIPAPAPGCQWASLLDAPVGVHSAKPEKFYELIEFYFPTLTKMELNRRGPPRKGWSAWGNEVEHDPETGEIKDPGADVASLASCAGAPAAVPPVAAAGALDT